MRSTRMLVLGLLVGVFALPALGEECRRDDPDLLLPDLVSIAPSQVRNARDGTHRLVLFSSTPANIGDGPLIVHGRTDTQPDGSTVTIAVQEIWKRDGSKCERDAGTFEFHPSHHHFHIGDFAAYQLRKDDPMTGQIMAESTKVSFCLLDIAIVRGFPATPQVQSDCLNQEGTQGISVGYADVYDYYLPGQNIDLDADPEHPVPGGTYYLVNIVNPDGILWEKDDSMEANIGYVSLRVPTVRSRLLRQPHSPGGPSGPSGPSDPSGPTQTTRAPRQPHTPRVPFNGPRPRTPVAPRTPHQPAIPGLPR